MGVHLAAERLKIEGFLGRHNNPEYSALRDFIGDWADGGISHPPPFICEHPLSKADVSNG
jgi:hypothetical protein